MTQLSANQANEQGSRPESLAAELCEALSEYLEPEQIDTVYQAFLFGQLAHQGQFRLSGETYICHPLAVARILAGMHMNVESIIAAILHDVLEDTETTKAEIAERFGDEVAELVDGVSKLTKINFESRLQAQAENFRKMVLAMVEDIRVIIIKLADRLHNMRTLGAMRADKRRRIARETLEIYAPIANRLGMNMMRIELQDLGFAEAYPMRYRVLADAVKRVRGNRSEVVTKVRTAIENRLHEEGLVCRVEGREKHLFSIYMKMKTKRLSFSDVQDVYAFRIIVDSADSCYRVLGVVHGLYKPMPGRFKDYIALPKNNGYQSLHTVLFGPYGLPIEVQIRADDMDKVAEAGVAAHWLYKLGDGASSRAQARARDWMRGLLEIQKTAGDSQEFLESVKIDLFPDVVYVFTPQGKIMELTRGATAVDFAYAVHTDIGNTCVAAKINRHLTPLSTPLHNGQTVEIITAPGARPNPSWLNFVVTGKARSTIRNYLKNLKRDEAAGLGRRLVEQALKGYSLTINDMPEAALKHMLSEVDCATLNQLFIEVGLGNQLAPFIARRLAEDLTSKHGVIGTQVIRNVWSRYMPSWLGGSPSQPALSIKGTEGMVVSYAKCCYPIPGDPIVGFISTGRGIVIHRSSCKNLADLRDRREKCIEVQWESEVETEFPVEIRVDVINRVGVLATLATAISDQGANINHVDIEDRDGRVSTLGFIITVHGRRHLASIMRHVRALEQVAKIRRRG
jgi:guanosine-3',5'-bis(diphosphate) 3'-pyrophosphohydrolase